jgi:hypothetical protein
MRHALLTVLGATLLLSLGGGGFRERPVEVPAPESIAAPLLQRMFVVGASASSGFLLDGDVGAPTTLTDIVEATLVVDHDPVGSATSLSFFLAPLSNGGKQIDKAIAHEPTLLLALDFLFWFGYGLVMSEQERLERIEQGLWLLDKFEGTVIVCDLPDMSPALGGRGPFGMPMLRPGQVPGRETLKLLNTKIAAWAAERENVVVVPLADFIARVHAGEPVEVRGNRWESTESLLNKDLLHPSLEGASALVVLAFDRLVAVHPEIPEEALRWDAAGVARRTYDGQEAEREKRLARKRARDERKRAREERRRREAEEPR